MMNAAERNNTVRGKLLESEPMARYTSWRVGGAAERFFEPADRDDLSLFLSGLAPDEPVLFVGLGSNLLVRDGGIKGTVVHLHGCLKELRVAQQRADSTIVYAEAGVTCAQLARFAVKQNLSGGGFFAGIPGTVGGALAMNAGAFGSETWQFVQSVETIARGATLRKRHKDEFEIAYRSVRRPVDEWFLGGYFCFAHDASDEKQNQIRALLNKRSATQPIGTYSCGSVFKNPADDYAARLIESCDLKGYRIGGAHVSEKHANFIINDANATAADIEKLILYVQSVVQQRCQVSLETEVIIVGEQA